MIFVNRIKFMAVSVLIFLLMPVKGFGETGENLLNLMPMPEKVDVREGKCRVTETFTGVIEAVPGGNTRRAGRTGIAVGEGGLAAEGIKQVFQAIHLDFIDGFQHTA